MESFSPGSIILLYTAGGELALVWLLLSFELSGGIIIETRVSVAIIVMFGFEYSHDFIAQNEEYGEDKYNCSPYPIQDRDDDSYPFTPLPAFSWQAIVFFKALCIQKCASLGVNVFRCLASHS